MTEVVATRFENIYIEKPAENGGAGRFGMAGREQPERLLVHDAYGSGKHGNDKGKTDKQWLL